MIEAIKYILEIRGQMFQVDTYNCGKISEGEMIFFKVLLAILLEQCT